MTERKAERGASAKKSASTTGAKPAAKRASRSSASKDAQPKKRAARKPSIARDASGLDRRRKEAQAKEGPNYAERRAHIVASAAAAFQEEGYDGATFADIANRAGTDRASVYYYASSKEELFQHVCSGMLAQNLAAAEDIAGREVSALEKLELVIAHHMNTHEQNYRQWTVLVQELRRVTEAHTEWSREEVARMHRYEEVVRQILVDGVADGTLRKDLNPDLAVHAIFGMLNWTHRWYRPNGRFSAAEIAKAFAGITSNGLSA